MKAESENTAASKNEQPAIVWLLNDLGDVLSRVSRAVNASANELSPAGPAGSDFTADDSVEAPAAKVDDAERPMRPLENPFAAIFRDLAQLFSQPESATTEGDALAIVGDPTGEDADDENTQPIEVQAGAELVKAATETDVEVISDSNARRNPISWLLSDLGSLLSAPATRTTLEEADASPVLEVPPQKAAEDTGALQDVTEVAGANDEFDASEDPADTSATASSNPVTQIFLDLAAVFQTVTNEPPLSGPQTAQVKEARTTNAEYGPIGVAQFNELSRERSEETHIAPDKDVAAGPWTRAAKDHLFDPSKSVVTDLETLTPEDVRVNVANGLAAPVPKESGSASTPLRTKEEPVFEARNHRALGRRAGQEEVPRREESLIANFMDAMFGEPEAIDERSETLAKVVPDRIVPEERLDLEQRTPSRLTSVPGLQSAKIGDEVLSDIDLYLGRDLVIGAAFDRQRFDAEACIDRPIHASVFCLTELGWPAEIADKFSRDTAFFNADEAVVRYENGNVSRVFTVFDAADFTDVVKFMQRRFGPPLERDIVWMNVMEAPALPNATFRWKAVTPDRRDIIVLEVRNYDDVRRSFANTEHGMVRLYREGSRPIFKHLTTMDLMLMQRRRVSRAPVDIDQPPPQR